MKKTIFLSIVLLATQTVSADVEAESFKYLVIDNDESVSDTAVMDTKNLEYEGYMASCLSLAKTEDFVAAEEACSSAISLSRNLQWPQKGLAKAYAYNNRGVVRYLASKKTAALDDFQRAVKLREMDAIRSNLEEITDRINNS